jgi:hypothetical protein
MQTHLDAIFLGLLASAFFTLIWRRLDSTDKALASVQVDIKGLPTMREFDRLDKTLGVIQTDLKQFYKDSGKIEGRVDELSGRVTRLEGK